MTEATLFRALLAAHTPEALFEQVHRVASRVPGSSGEAGFSNPHAEAPREPYVIWGAGEFVREVLDRWGPGANPPLYLIDSNPQKWGSPWCGHRVRDPATLAGDPRKPLVVVAVMDTHGLQPRISAMGLRLCYAERDGTLGALPGHNLWRDRERFERVYSMLDDEASRAVYLAVAKARLFQDFWFPMKGHWFTVEASTQPQYFIEGLPPWQPGECFIDCGAFDGDTVVDFAAQMWRQGIDDWSALAIEADPANAAGLSATLSRFGLEHQVSVLHAMLGDGLPARAHNCREGEATQAERTVSLPQALGDRLPGFIKMDIEGAELATLQGGVDCLAQHRPRLAVCLYHRSSDLVEIPSLISRHLPFYRLKIRHHRSGSLWETVLYAIPR